MQGRRGEQAAVAQVAEQAAGRRGEQDGAEVGHDRAEDRVAEERAEHGLVVGEAERGDDVPEAEQGRREQCRGLGGANPEDQPVRHAAERDLLQRYGVDRDRDKHPQRDLRPAQHAGEQPAREGQYGRAQVAGRDDPNEAADQRTPLPRASRAEPMSVQWPPDRNMMPMSTAETTTAVSRIQDFAHGCSPGL